MGEKPDTIKKPRTRATSSTRRRASDVVVPGDDVVVPGDDEIIVSAIDEDDEVEVSATDSDDTTPGSEAIREEIEETRAQMSGTINEIQARLSPRRLMDEAKETVRDATVGKVKDVMNTAGDSAGGIVDRIKENPFQAALIGLGAWWLFGKRNQPSGYGRTSQSYQQPGYLGQSGVDRWNDRTAFGSSAGVMDTLKQHPIPTALASVGVAVWLANRQSNSGYPRAMSNAYDTNGGRWSGQTGDSGWSGQTGGGGVSEMAHDATEAVSDFGARAQEHIGEYAERTQERVVEYADRAQTEFDRLMRDNPFALGAVAVVVGTAIGMAIPESQREREWMGDVREQLADKAQNLAQGAVEKVQQVASKLSEEGAKPNG